MMERLKDIIVIVFSTLLGFFAPIGDFIAAILILMAVDFISGLAEDELNGTGWKGKNAHSLVRRCTDTLHAYLRVHRFSACDVFTAPTDIPHGYFLVCSGISVNPGEGIGKGTFAYRQGGKACKHDVHQGGIG